MKILDATCGMKSIWYQKNHPFVTFLDQREGKITTLRPGNKLTCKRTINIKPDIVGDFRDTPFDDNEFDLVVFDPPHIIKRDQKPPSLISMRYGSLQEENYKQVLKDGFRELFRILKPEGILIFKWCENSKKLNDILEIIPYKPMFGTRTGQRNNTHWVLFIKYRPEKTLKEFA